MKKIKKVGNSHIYDNCGRLIGLTQIETEVLVGTPEELTALYAPNELRVTAFLGTTGIDGCTCGQGGKGQPPQTMAHLSKDSRYISGNPTPGCQTCKPRRNKRRK